MKLNKLTILECFKGLRNGEFTSEELTRDCLKQIKDTDKKINAYLTVDEEGALAKAKEVDEKIKNGDKLAPLAGIPVSIKDIFCTAGLRSTGASKILENYIPPYDSTVVKKIKDQDGVILGKVNCDEFAMGASGENSAYKKTKNPKNIERVPGGSSSGSVASVAADQCIYSIGSDTGGSIRQPAGFCGVVGLKPTYGRVSRYGVMAMTSSLDSMGPIAKSVEDVAFVLEQIAGCDKKDSTTLDLPLDDYSKALKTNIKGLKIGLPKEYFIEGIQQGVKKRVMEAVKKFEKMGAEVIDVSLPHTDLAVAAYYIICPSEVSSNMARYDGIKYGFSDNKGKNLLDIYLDSRSKGFGAEVKRRIMIGTYALSSGYYDAYYKQAMKVRTLVKQDFDKAFENVDIILTPVSPDVAFKIGEKSDDPLQLYMEDVFTVPASLAGICGLSVPAGEVDGLPVGIQLLGRRFDEKTILRAGYQFENN